jgi:hypothetical protein
LKNSCSKVLSLNRGLVCLIFLVIVCAPTGFSQDAANPQSDPFAAAVRDYSQNKFFMARTEFEKVDSAHAREAQQYIVKINAYLDDMDVANGIINRPADELDPSSLEYAIQKFEDALKIKSDGPQEPAKALQKAKDLYAPLAQRRSQGMDERDRDLCNKARQAAQRHQYQQAVLFSCPLANDSPAYSCGGDEAVHMCQQMTDLSKVEEAEETPNDDVSPPLAADPVAKAKAAFEKNDFAKARLLLANLPAAQKPVADEYMNKIDRYQALITQAQEFSRTSQYDAARAAFISAAQIKSDGPGDPQGLARLMQLEEGIEQFYSGEYVSAVNNLESYTSQTKDKDTVAHFYLGASKLAKFFITGAADAKLKQAGLQDLKIAKEAGYTPRPQDLSPRILQAYDAISF